MSCWRQMLRHRLDPTFELRREAEMSEEMLRTPAEHVCGQDVAEFGDTAKHLVENQAELSLDAGGWSCLFGVAHFIDGNLLQARAELSVALALDPERPLAYRYLALILRDEGEEELANRVMEIGWACQEELLAPSTEEDRERFFHPGPAERDVDRLLQAADSNDNDRADA